jgi:hypothetical protein
LGYGVGSYPAAHVADFALSSPSAGSFSLGATGGLESDARGARSGFGVKMLGAADEPLEEGVAPSPCVCVSSVQCSVFSVLSVFRMLRVEG